MSFRERWWCCDINDRKFVERAIYYRNSNYDVWNKALLYTPNSQPLFTPKCCSLKAFLKRFLCYERIRKRRGKFSFYSCVLSSRCLAMGAFYQKLASKTHENFSTCTTKKIPRLLSWSTTRPAKTEDFCLQTQEFGIDVLVIYVSMPFSYFYSRVMKSCLFQR